MSAHYLSWGDLAIAYGESALIASAVAALVIWIAMVCQSGVVRGGLMGLLPALVVGSAIGLAWPALLIAVFLWRDPVNELVTQRIAPRRHPA
jgi:hypothetical protein